MPIPTFSGLPPYPEFQDVVNKINKLVNELRNLMLNLDSLNVISLTADHIDAGTIDAGVVTVRADYASGAYVEIGPTGMKIFDGSKFTFNVDISGNVTMTGATVQSTSGYPKVVMEPTSNFLQAAQDANRYVVITPFNTSTPAIQLFDGLIGKSLLMYVSPLANGTVISSVGDLQVGAGGSDLKLTGNNVTINGTNFNSKADKTGVFKSGYISSTPGGPADTFISIGNGVVTS